MERLPCTALNRETLPVINYSEDVPDCVELRLDAAS
jgi:hypothetical protein